MPNILVISDTKHKDVAVALKKSDVRIVESSLSEFMPIMELERLDCVVLCAGKTFEDAESVINGIKAFDDNLPIIVVGVESLEDAVSLMKIGAYDCLRFPLNRERLQLSAAKAVHIYNLTRRVFILENQAGLKGGFDSIIGRCPKMQEIFQLIATVSKSNATVLVLGESGTGKELVAKAVHKHSPRASREFIDINCGAIPRELLENELFGHERGSYTGADRRYIGCCERADKGTLFLDEICEMEASLQVKILRLLQERTFTRVGGNEPLKSDIRFIAATNKDILAEVRSGAFREDLFYRLNVVPITMPPLRDRIEDIPLLAKHFLEKFSTKNEKMFVDIEPEALECLMNHNWPGNVRELENAIERVVVLHNDTSVKAKFLPPQLQKLVSSGRHQRPYIHIADSESKIMPLDQVEKYAVASALSKCGGNVYEAARHLKIGQATLYRKIKAFGLKS